MTLPLLPRTLPKRTATNFVLSAPPCLHDHLADALARTHDVRRVHGLIRRDEHEGLRAVAVRSLRHMERSEYVIFNGLVRASLHQRHMLVRRSVEHDVRPVLRKQELTRISSRTEPMHTARSSSGCVRCSSCSMA